MTTKKAAAKKPAKKAEQKPQSDSSETVTEAAGPEMEGEAYQAGFHGVSGDEEDYSIAAEVARLNEA